MLLTEGNYNNVGVETIEGTQIIMEAIVQEMLEQNNDIISESDVYSLIQEGLLGGNKSIVRLSKKAKKNHLIQKSTIVLAKEHNDPLYQKLIKALKARRKITDYFYKKYYSKAVQRVNKTIAMGNKAQPSIFKKIDINKLKPTSVFKSSEAPKK